jgi:hypothetical protein
MSKKELHPSVQQFKEFVKKHPKMVSEVRKGHANWQELYEEWYLLGEEDSRWDDFKEASNMNDTTPPKKEGNKEWFPQILGAIKNMDSNQLQGQITHVSQALGAIQGLISQFNGGKTSPTKQNQTNQPQHPFQFRKD